MRRVPPAVGLGASVALALAAIVVGVAFGAVHIPFDRVVALLVGGLDPAVDGFRWQRIVVLDVRLPRVVAALFVGGGLAVAGAALQGLFRNPLADPGVIGVSSGASLGAVLAIQLGLGIQTAWSLPVTAIVFAAATAFSVYSIASRRGRLPVGTLLLAGIAVGSLASALTSFVLSIALDEYEQGRQMFRWLMGGLEARTWSEVWLVAPTTLAGAAVIMISARELDALLVGETEAAAVGIDVIAVRRRILAASSIVVGGAVAVSGVIGFVGLVIPHIVRLLMGPAHAALLPTSLAFGAAFLVVADVLARVLLAPEEIRLGVVTALVGTPFFLFLLVQRRREMSIE